MELLKALESVNPLGWGVMKKLKKEVSLLRLVPLENVCFLYWKNMDDKNSFRNFLFSLPEKHRRQNQSPMHPIRMFKFTCFTISTLFILYCALTLLF